MKKKLSIAKFVANKWKGLTVSPSTTSNIKNTPTPYITVDEYQFLLGDQIEKSTESLTGVGVFLRDIYSSVRAPLRDTISFTIRYIRKPKERISTTLNLRTEKEEEHKKFLLSGRLDLIGIMFPIKNQENFEVVEITLYAPKNLVVDTSKVTDTFGIASKVNLFGLKLGIKTPLIVSKEKEFIRINIDGIKIDPKATSIFESEDIKEVFGLRSRLGDY